MRKKNLCLFVVLMILLSFLTGCGNKESDSSSKDGYTTLSFQSSSLDEAMKLNGKTVQMSGYLSVLTPLNGDTAYLVNLPLQNCPFCTQNSKQLANTMTVKFKDKLSDFTDQPIRVTGKMVVASFTDDYGYEYPFRIEDATYEILDDTTLPEGFSMYYTLSADGDIFNLYSMMNCIDYFAYYDMYEIPKETILAEMPPDFNTMFKCQETIDKVESLNDPMYDDFINMLKECQKCEPIIKKGLEQKDTTVMNEMKPIIDKVYQSFNNFIVKYTF